jgi:hypothetical protein
VAPAEVQLRMIECNMVEFIERVQTPDIVAPREIE